MSSFNSVSTMNLFTRNICFVCGSVGAFKTVHVKSRESGSYFPFLEHHDPPKGSVPPGPDGSVLSCNVCYSFLNQQWQAFERSKTPAIKRLYWLKRADNGQFTGAEMRWQGEYAAQVMGLQYTPGSYGAGDDHSPTDSRASLVSPSPVKALAEKVNRDNLRMNFESVRGCIDESNGALDLSMPSRGTKNHSQESANVDKNAESCNAELARTSTGAPGNSRSNALTCFLCATSMNGSHGRSLYSCKQSDKEPYFPFLEQLTPPPGSIPVAKKGMTRVCGSCKKSLVQQWKAYEVTRAPEERRVYRINNEAIGFGNSSNTSQSFTLESSAAEEVCYLCAQVNKSENMKDMYTRASENSNMYFSFITHLQCPPRAKLIDSYGHVRACKSCFLHLQQQWQLFESDGLSENRRHYSLRPLHSVLNTSNASSFSASATNNLHLNQPLNIHISSATPPTISASPSQGLLAIAPDSNAQTSTKIKSQAFGLHKNQSGPSSQAGSKSLNVSAIKGSSSHASNERQNTPASNQLIVCFLCGFRCSGGRYYILRSFPCKEEENVSIKPFFPFLTKREPAGNAEPITADGSVKSCRYCYHSLILQWGAYEIICDPMDAKRWMRNYSVNVFVCYICTAESERKKMRTIQVKKFPFLIKHACPPGAVVIDHGDSVVVCCTCERTLARQFDDYERMGVEISLRQYNWIAKAMDSNSKYFAEIGQVSGIFDIQCTNYFVCYKYTTLNINM